MPSPSPSPAPSPLSAALKSFPAPSIIESTFDKDAEGLVVPHPPSPPVQHARSRSTVSELDLQSVDKKTRRVAFFDMVQVQYTYGSEEYDRTSIQVDPLTPADITFILRLRAEMHRHTIDLYRRRHLAEYMAKECDRRVLLQQQSVVGGGRMQFQQQQQQQGAAGQPASLPIPPR
ncbi:hypothetical protein HK104_007183, partial [Borealophlyctis nickersoniae]